MTRVALVRYNQNGKEHVTNHATLEGLEGDLVERIKRTYGHEPESITYKARGGLWLDTGGMALVDQPVLVCRLKGYAVRYKLEHAPYLALNLRERIDDLSRRRTYGGRECVTIYMRFWIVVLPLEDALKVLAHLKKNSARGLVVGDQRRAELALLPDVHIPDKRPVQA